MPFSGYNNFAIPLWTVNYALQWPVQGQKLSFPPCHHSPPASLMLDLSAFPCSKKNPTSQSKTDKINVTSLVEEHLSFLESIHDVLKWKGGKTRPNNDSGSMWYHTCFWKIQLSSIKLRKNMGRKYTKIFWQLLSLKGSWVI